MKRHLLALALAALLAGTFGCNSLFNALLPNQTSVQLVNDGDFPVNVELYYGNDQNALKSLLTTFGQKVEVTVQPGDTYSFAENCDSLQAIVIENADLDVVGPVGPSADTEVYRDGTDFNCGDTLVFTFTHPAIPTSLNINFSTR